MFFVFTLHVDDCSPEVYIVDVYYFIMEQCEMLESLLRTSNFIPKCQSLRENNE